MTPTDTLYALAWTITAGLAVAGGLVLVVDQLRGRLSRPELVHRLTGTSLAVAGCVLGLAVGQPVPWPCWVVAGLAGLLVAGLVAGGLLNRPRTPPGTPARAATRPRGERYR